MSRPATRRLPWLTGCRKCVVLAAVFALAGACSDDGSPERAAGPSPSPSPSPSGATVPSRPEETKTLPGVSHGPEEPTPLPEVPSTSSATALAGEVGRALQTLRATDASPAEVQRAAEFHQLAARALATSPDRFVRRVIRGLGPEDAAVLRSDVGAAGLLRAMTDPQPALPRWRIMTPPAADDLETHYRAAARRFGVPWTYLAAIHLVETRMGRIRGTSTAGARGPMQFIPPTWARYGAGGDIEDPRDAIYAAARLLRANGAPDDMATALWHYNPSRNYVRAVTSYARTMRRSDWTFRSYWHWRVLYRHVRGTYVLPVGYPKARPVLVDAAGH
jgi:hypothetical protein